MDDNPNMKVVPRCRGASLFRVALLVAAAASTAASSLSIDPSRSEVGFLLDTTWHGVEGRTKAVTGTLTSESGDVFADGRVEVRIEAATLDTGNGMRDRKMRDECLETSKYPTITFLSSAPPVILSSTKDSSGGYREASLTVTGDLTIHGVQRSVALPVTARREGDAWLISGTLPVKLSDYAIPDPSIVINKVKDEVTVTFTVQVKRAPAAESRD